MDLFEYQARKDVETSKPLAERMRPEHLDMFVGQKHIAGRSGLIRKAIESDRIFSMIFWGPPGCGKTTLAQIIARLTHAHFVQFSAVLAGIKQIRAVIDEAKSKRSLKRQKTILFVDEIHRFNKAQQDAFLQHVETGLITLIGATTENPSFEVIPALISRCRVITLKPLSSEHICTILERALDDRDNGLGSGNCKITEQALVYLADIADGDVRTALNGLEIAADLAVSENVHAEPPQSVEITLEAVTHALQKKALLYDKNGEEHFNLISAFHKSLRGSDPDASVYWLTRMLSAGEDPFYIIRRMVRFASEDIGNADPQALTIALNAMQSFKFLGSPEGELAIAQAAVYLASAPKSNSVYMAYKAVQKEIKTTGALPVPLHIRNAPTALMKGQGYGRDYKYAHDFEDAYTQQEYLPEKLQGRRYYHPVNRGYEQIIKQYMEKLSQKSESG
ncbi:replication-associated recombination protein A [Desulfococcaceae bacterium HSG7]|nr:replication-associated recombination protein A [Desulfococcaceae bacterium HSG7]